MRPQATSVWGLKLSYMRSKCSRAVSMRGGVTSADLHLISKKLRALKFKGELKGAVSMRGGVTSADLPSISNSLRESLRALTFADLPLISGSNCLRAPKNRHSKFGALTCRLLLKLFEPLIHLTCSTIRQHTSAYVSIRQHTSAYRYISPAGPGVSIRQHTPAYVSIRQRTSA